MLSRRLLLAFSCLLLIPLLVMKWRANWIQDHPSLSKVDRQLRATLLGASSVSIDASSNEKGDTTLWQQLTGTWDKQLIVKDKAALREITENLRCTDHWGHEYAADFRQGGITIRVRTYHPKTHHFGWAWFTYWRTSQGSYLCPVDNGWGDTYAQRNNYVEVQPRFAPRFEALITRLYQRAKAPGTHPQITLKPWNAE